VKGDKKLGPIKNLEAEIIEDWRCWRCHAEKEAKEALEYYRGNYDQSPRRDDPFPEKEKL